MNWSLRAAAARSEPEGAVMLRLVTASQQEFLKRRFRDIVAATPVPFSTLTPTQLPEKAGVYVISARWNRLERAYYVGRTKNLRQRIYSNHVMGSATNARLKKYLTEEGECKDMATAKQFLRTTCWVRWILQEGHRERGAVEGYVTGLLFPKYGIYEEH